MPPRRRIVLPCLALIAAAVGLHRLVRSDPAAPAGPSCTKGCCGAPPKQIAPVAYVDKSNVHNTVVNAFPGAMKGSAVMSKLFSAVRPYGFTKSNTVFGTSTCPDEINGDRGHLTTLLTKHYGTAFPLGGLGGVPSVGKTGFFAFSHHVPDGGHVLVVFGPHIGFTHDGRAGRFLRRGQADASTACGALNAAYSQLASGASTGADPRDAQQSWIRARLQPYMPDVESSPQPMIALVRRFYKIVEEEMLAIATTDYGPGNLVLLGGITINMPYPRPGYFLPLHFSVRSKATEPKDLMSTFDG